MEEEAVYTALFEESERLIVLESKVYSRCDSIKSIRKQLADISQDVFDDYLNRNKDTEPFSKIMNIGVRYVFLDCNLLAKRAQGNLSLAEWWNEFYRVYPDAGGIYQLSRVGFNSTRTQALVYCGNHFHCLAGAGVFWLLKKVNGVWRKDKDIMTWIS